MDIEGQEAFKSESSFRAALNEIATGEQETVAEEVGEEIEEEELVPEEGEEQNLENSEEEEEDERSEDSEEEQSEDGAEEANMVEEDDDEDSGHMVPRGRLNKEKDKRHSLEVQNVSLQKELEAKENELQQFVQAVDAFFGENKEQEPQTGDIQPLDEQSHNYLANEIKGLKKELQSRDEQTAQNEQLIKFQRFEGDMRYQESAFKEQTPDFSDAYNYLFNLESKKVEAAVGNPELAKQHVFGDFQRTAFALWENGQNVAETVYNMAKAAGYNPKASQQKKSAPNLDKIERNMKKTRTIGKGGENGIMAGAGIPSTSSKFGQAYKKGGKEGFYKMLETINKQAT